MAYEDIIHNMTLKDKIALCSGKDFWRTQDFPMYNIPSIMMVDGPHGLRKQRAQADMLGINEAIPATCFPTAVTSGATWNKELIYKMGKAIGEEAKAEEVAIVLGPGVNIKRNPLCGRNFEYFSEDPFLSGKLGSSYVKGMQESGIGTSVKHFAANSQEYKRFSSDSQMNERTLRELYLAAFEIVVKEAQPASVMCAYNKINGTFCSDNKQLLNSILREEWGFKGLVVTDWGAMGDRIEGFQAGCDLSMPGGASYQEKEVFEAVKEGKLKEDDINKCVNRILEIVFHGREVISKKEDITYDTQAHQKLAANIASEGGVLLKNEDNILPIKDMKNVTLIGHMAKAIRYQGSGSSHINPTKLIQVADVITNAKYCEGCDAKGDITESQIKQVEHAAKEAEKVVVFAGLTDNYESEGFDRDNMSIPDGHNQMIEAALKGNPNTIVVLMGGSVMKLPWFDNVKAVLYMGLCGQSGGQAIADILSGKVNPSGKLTETWPLEESHVPSFGFYSGKQKNAQYREGIFVGYRYYERANVKVRFPFGYGLSYTTFEYTNLEVDENVARVTITNTGDVFGAEVVQLYIGAPKNGIYRAKKELKGFEKVFLNAGECKVIEFELDNRSFAIYQNGWVIPQGTYEVLIGASSDDIRLSAAIEKEGIKIENPIWQKRSWYENPNGQPSKAEWEKLMGKRMSNDSVLKKGDFDLNNTLLELRDYSFLAKIMCKSIEQTIAKGMGMKPDYTNQEFRLMIYSSMDSSLRGMIISSCGKFPAKLAECIVESANGHTLRGIAKLIGR
jgi:Beta-glucosidase-related glycosidases